MTLNKGLKTSVINNLPRVVSAPTASSITMPITKYYYPDANLELTAKYNDNKSLTRGRAIHLGQQ